MNTSLEHLPALKREQLMTITKVIIQAVHPEKIILFGTHVTTGKGPDPFTDKQLAAFLGGYDLLVVTRRGERRYDHELQDLVENRCRMHTPVTVLVHDIDYVNSQMQEGHYFFSMMSREAILLYDAGSIPLAQAAPPNLVHIRAVAQRDFERWKLHAEAFFKSALFNKQQKERKIAAFLLHQAAEQIYQAILLAFTGYKPCTHNLDKLRRYTNRFSIELALLFPRNNAEEDHLFKLLLQGYVDARYKEEYTITEEELSLLTERIAKLLSIAERVCSNRFTSLIKMAAAG
jgi:HEPN domain-containing protein